MHRRVGVVLLAVLLLPVLSCTERDPETIEFWTLALRPVFTDYIESRIDAFESANPGATVVWVDVPYDALDRKLIASAAAGRAPDVVNFADRTFARFAALGALEDLGPLVPGEPGEQYLEGALVLGRTGGGLRALPWYLSTQVLIVNEALAAEGGLNADDLPRDWSSLQAMARGFHERTGAFLFTVPLGHDSELPMMLHASGLAPFREEDGRVVADLTRDEIVVFLEGWMSLYRDGALPREAATRGFDHLIELYQSGRVAMINAGPTKLASIRDAAPSIYETTVALEPVTGALGRAHIAEMVVSVTTQSANPELAARFAWFMTGPESQLEFCRHPRANILPSTSATLDDPMFTSGLDSDDAIVRSRAIAAVALRDAVAFTPAIETWPDLRRVFEERFKGVLLGEDDLRATLVEIEREWNSILADAPPIPPDAIPRPAPVRTAALLEVGLPE